MNPQQNEMYHTNNDDKCKQNAQLRPRFGVLVDRQIRDGRCSRDEATLQRRNRKHLAIENQLGVAQEGILRHIKKKRKFIKLLCRLCTINKQEERYPCWINGRNPAQSGRHEWQGQDETREKEEKVQQDTG